MMMKNGQSFGQSLGQSLFEVVVAIAIVTLILTAVVALGATSIRNTSASKNRAEATLIAQAASEWLRGERDANWSQFITRAASPVWCLPEFVWEKATFCSNSDRIGLFKREVEFSLLDPITVQSSVVVTWEDAQGVHEVRTTTFLTDPRAQ